MQRAKLKTSWIPTENTCHAVDHTSCIFPFQYKGHHYGQCTTDHYSWFGGWWHANKRWCATAVDESSGEMTSWNYCEHSCHEFNCATTGGHRCNFPFKLSPNHDEL